MRNIVGKKFRYKLLLGLSVDVGMEFPFIYRVTGLMGYKAQAGLDTGLKKRLECARDTL